MANVLPEGTAVQPKDSEWRSTYKWAQIVFAMAGNKPCQFPEGTVPLPKDTEDRLEQKILVMLYGVPTPPIPPVTPSERTTEEGDTRVTEEGDTRIIED